MKILILVLSYNKPPFDMLMKNQQRTWDNVPNQNVDTIYYHGGGDPENMLTERAAECHYPENNSHYGIRLAFKCTDAYYYMAAKFKKVLEWVDLREYSIIFRTNSSSYIHKNKLVEFAKTLPTEKLYAGWTFTDSEDFGGGCVSGAGIFLSRDTAKILMDEIDPNKELEEDVYIGRILRKHGITAIDDKSRYDVPITVPNDFPTDRYHYRCKATGNRLADIQNMRVIHKILNP